MIRQFDLRLVLESSTGGVGKGEVVESSGLALPSLAGMRTHVLISLILEL
jgi:hypothetical protein